MEQAIRLYKERIKAMGYLSPNMNEDTQVWPTRLLDAYFSDKNPLDLTPAVNLSNLSPQLWMMVHPYSDVTFPPLFLSCF